MPFKTAVVLALPLLLGITSCSGKASKAECQEIEQSIKDVDPTIEQFEEQIEMLESFTSGGGGAEYLQEQVDLLKELRLGAIKESREKGCR